MDRIILLAILATALAACDSQRLYPDELMPSETLSYLVEYRVQGTYATCDITYSDPQEGRARAQQVSLPWERSVGVTVDQRTGPFDAFVKATCADPTKMGKSTAAVVMNGQIKSQDSATGFGATSEASFQIKP